MIFCRLLIFSKSTFWKISFRNSIRVSNSLDPDQARHFVRSDLGPNCLQRLSADGTISWFSVICWIFFSKLALSEILLQIPSECQTILDPAQHFFIRPDLSQYVCMTFLSLVFFFKINICKKFYQNTIRVSNSLDPDQSPKIILVLYWSKLFAKVLSRPH